MISCVMASAQERAPRAAAREDGVLEHTPGPAPRVPRPVFGAAPRLSLSLRQAIADKIQHTACLPEKEVGANEETHHEASRLCRAHWNGPLTDGQAFPVSI